MYIKNRDIASIAASSIPKYLGMFDLHFTCNNRCHNNYGKVGQYANYTGDYCYDAPFLGIST